MEQCKSNDSYLIVNDNIIYDKLDATSACTDLNNSDPRWIGVIRDQYVKSDQGKPAHYVFTFSRIPKVFETGNLRHRPRTNTNAFWNFHYENIRWPRGADPDFERLRACFQNISIPVRCREFNQDIFYDSTYRY